MLVIIILYIIIRLIISESNKANAEAYSKKWNAEHPQKPLFDREKFERTSGFQK